MTTRRSFLKTAAVTGGAVGTAAGHGQQASRLDHHHQFVIGVNQVEAGVGRWAVLGGPLPLHSLFHFFFRHNNQHGVFKPTNRPLGL